ncbi:hypothetical protein AAF712_011017 [Marasmius tenuissimus]|uniref:Uncharacterized protein n=1 Tax=Marasmius tenuissimus TaxID=585030 RepID=A0ABR2ZLH8_9AGAR
MDKSGRGDTTALGANGDREWQTRTRGNDRRSKIARRAVPYTMNRFGPQNGDLHCDAANISFPHNNAAFTGAERARSIASDKKLLPPVRSDRVPATEGVCVGSELSVGGENTTNKRSTIIKFPPARMSTGGRAPKKQRRLLVIKDRKMTRVMAEYELDDALDVIDR